MPIYKLSRHVVYEPREQKSIEVWGIDRKPTSLPVQCAPRDTDIDDPLRSETCCSSYLLLLDSKFVKWHHISEWFSFAEDAGYEVISGFKKLSPYSTILVRGP
jgi:hypothetical protein